LSWIHLLPAMAEIIGWLDGMTGSEYSEYMAASSARVLMDRIAPDLELAGVEIELKTFSHGSPYMSSFVELVDSLPGITERK
jgi:hypothetical protein